MDSETLITLSARDVARLRKMARFVRGDAMRPAFQNILVSPDAAPSRSAQVVASDGHAVAVGFTDSQPARRFLLDPRLLGRAAREAGVTVSQGRVVVSEQEDGIQVSRATGRKGTVALDALSYYSSLGMGPDVAAERAMRTQATWPKIWQEKCSGIDKSVSSRVGVWAPDIKRQMKGIKAGRPRKANRPVDPPQAYVEPQALARDLYDNSLVVHVRKGQLFLTHRTTESAWLGGSVDPEHYVASRPVHATADAEHHVSLHLPYLDRILQASGTQRLHVGLPDNPNNPIRVVAGGNLRVYQMPGFLGDGPFAEQRRAFARDVQDRQLARSPNARRRTGRDLSL